MYSTKGYENKLAAVDQVLRQEAEKKVEEYAAVMKESEFLAWRDKFVR